MATEYLIFDADGDMLLLLGQPSIPGAKDKAVTLGIDPDLTIRAYEKTLDNPMESTEISNRDCNAMIIDLDEYDNEYIYVPEKTPPAPEMHMLVSSKTLMIASPVFKAMLQKGRFREGCDLESGKAEVHLDDDPAAFRILMNILHFNTRKVPRTVELQTMTNLAVLIDKYSVLEPVEVFVEHWITHLRGSMPTSLTNDLLSWICIGWVFRSTVPEVLANIVEVALRWSDGNFQSNGTQELPIPECLLSKQ